MKGNCDINGPKSAKSCYDSISRKMTTTTGADTGFSFGGGGGGGEGAQRIMCPHVHYERGTELTFGRGPARLRAL